jgi:3-deoxy-7-phosphoheptulonate synthase
MIALAKTSGNPDCHVILRGGTNGPNYNEDSIASIIDQLERAGLTAEVMIDASHKNSGGDYRKQIEVVRNVSGQVSRGSVAVIGMMIESNLKEGSQPFTPGEKHKYGVSITDGCVNLNQTTEMFGLMSEAVKSRAA